MYESEIQNQIKKILHQLGFTMFRNNVGAWRNPRGHWIRYGLGGPGGSDLIGWRPIMITPDMVGSKIAQFVAIETKRPSKSKVTDQQSHFIHVVKECGGIGIIASSIADLKEYIA